MLEIRDLCKVYRPKKGVPVTAVDHISLRLPDQGMVFLLGKSGSGKSTLLNLLGGLDTYDSGDILIKGTSTKTFRQQEFDSYRNTYVGFIFQEYNVLEEFTVGANIGLALELQGKKATDEQINAILQQVDLTGFGARRPNELSGGQKQRVAIARALVKEPKIIMADEPTGALDSDTGRQIFDTLKKLSAQRLVIVVSHDREFAEQYADRIIELADGHVISDCTYLPETATAESGLTYSGDTVTIAPGYHLTEEDRAAINAYLDKLQTGSTLRAVHCGSKRVMATDNDAIQTAQGDLNLVRSRLPLRNAFKIGGSSLKHKKLRLVITILLSCIAFGLFGLADTFGSYNHIQACTDSLQDSHIDYATMQKAIRQKNDNNEKNAYYQDGYNLTQQDIDTIQKETGLSMKGIYVPIEANLSLSNHFHNSDSEKEKSRRAAYQFNGFAEVTASELTNYGYALAAGYMPNGDRDEVAITAYCADSFLRYGFTDTVSGKPLAVKTYADFVGKKLALDGYDYTITGVVDTRFDTTRYAFLDEPSDNLSNAQRLKMFALMEELNAAQNYSLHTTLFTGTGRVQKMIESGHTLRPLRFSYLYFYAENGEGSLDPSYIGSLEDVKNTPIVWLDGKERTQLGEKELVISPEMAGLHEEDLTDTEAVKQSLITWQQRMGSWQEDSQRCFQDGEHKEIGGYQVVGFLDTSRAPSLRRVVLTSTSMRDAFTQSNAGPYAMAIGAMPKEKDAIRQLVSFCYREDDIRFSLKNAVTYELDVIHEMLEVLSNVFLWIGVGFAVFAALMLANFISTSISYKKQEIGILRAIGSRSNDVFRIFFSESFIIAMINLVLSGIGVATATALINGAVRAKMDILLTVLHFGVRQVFLLLVISLAVAAIASFFPVQRIASKRPIDAIRNR